ncbi:hypothetical protein AB0M02_38200 [Actinoplanes sp. NPDC051861]|uniref:hypothetical protein n=1 Tax=Actinoplanes sp. NPDC051861 TaxID=3155170 RepID=UPI00343111C6
MTTTNDETAILARVDEPDHDSLSAELAAAAPRRWWNRGTVGLGVAVLLMGGFLGGVQAQKQWGATTTAAAPGGFTRGSGGGGFPSGGFGQNAPTPATTAAAAAGTTGKVKLVNGKTIYVETEDGTVVTVKTDGDTSVATAKKGKLSDVKAGDSITVEGATAEDGSVTATSVTKK